MSCKIIHSKHEYQPYVIWRSVNPFLSRIEDAKEKEEFVEELHKTTMNSLEVFPEYPSSWMNLLVSHLKKV